MATNYSVVQINREHLKMSQEVSPRRIDFKLETTFKEVSPLIQIVTFLNVPN
jgi:hypothetical protein